MKKRKGKFYLIGILLLGVSNLSFAEQSSKDRLSALVKKAESQQGGQTPAPEVGGIFSHWYNELALRRALSVPVVTAAVDALELALSEIIYVPDDKERDEIMKSIEESNMETTAITEE